MAPVVEVIGLTKRYGQRTAVRNVTFSIEQGDIVGLLGANGAGKSTTLRAIVGLIRPTQGQVRLFGEAFHYSLLRRVGVLIDRADLWPFMTGSEVITHVLRLKGIQPDANIVTALLERVGIASAANQRVRTYSYGMRRRLALAAALAGDPELVILDEPVNGLDPQGIADVRALIIRLHREGKTVLISSHLLAEIEQIATRLLVLHEGMLIADGAIVDLLAQATDTAVIEAIDSAEHMLEVLGRSFSATKVRPNAVRIAVGDVDRAAACLVAAGIRLQAIIPDRSLEQFYFTATGRNA